MNDLTEAIRAEVEDLHVFFVDWFTGAAPRDRLKVRFGAAMDKDVLFISPDGAQLRHADLMAGIGGAYGANADIRIAVRDVTVRREIGDLVLATYTEWQINAARVGREKSGRLSTVLMTRAAPHRWLHIHECWLPEDVQAAGPYDF